MKDKNNTFLEEITKESEDLSQEETEEEKETKDSSNTIKTPPTQSFLVQTLTSYLSKAQIKDKLGDIKQELNTEHISSELLNDQHKIDTYDRLEVQDLPQDWKEQLKRIPQLEVNQEKHQINDLKPQDYEQIKQELNEWNNTFKSQSPEEVNQLIKELEQRPEINQESWKDYQSRKTNDEFQTITNKLKEWTDAFTNQTPTEAKNEQVVLLEREKELKQWQNEFLNQTPQEVKQQIEELKERPNISEQEWVDKQQEVQKLNNELEQTKNSLTQWENSFPQKDNQQIQQEITNWEKDWSVKNQQYEKAVQELETWKKILESEEPNKVKEKITELEQRPNIHITEQQWWDDYSGRKSHTQSQQEQAEWEKDKQKIKDYEQEIRSLLEIEDLEAWKLELTKLKGKQEGLITKIKMALNLSEEEELPENWHQQLISRNQLELLRNSWLVKEEELKAWKYYFPRQTPEQLEQEKKEWKRPKKMLEEWNNRFPDKTAKEMEKEIRHKDTEIGILKQQIEELGGTVGANPSEKLIESKLREVIAVEEWNVGYLLQVLKRFQEWRENGSSEQRRAIAKYWLVIKRNIEYLQARERQVSKKHI